MTSKENVDAGQRYGWLSRQSMSLRVVLATLTVTVAIMASMAAVLMWQSNKSAVSNVQREMQTALMAADQSFQLVFESAQQRGRDLIPVLIKNLGGEPVLDGNSVATGEAGQAPALVVGDNVVNGDISALLRLNESTGADPAVIVRAGGNWVRVATLLTNDKGERRIGSTVAPDDLLSRTLDSGKEFSGLVQRNGKWYAMSILPLRDAAGTVYGGLTVRVNVDADVTRLLAWMSQVKIAEYGTLIVLQPTADGKDWTYVIGGGAKQGDRLEARLGQADRASLQNLFQAKSGFAGVDLNSVGDTFVAWQSVDNWNWLMVATGQRADFLAASHRDLMIQMLLMLVGTLVIAALVGWLASATLRPVQHMIAAMSKVGQGDLTGELPNVPDTSRNEVHVLFSNLALMQANLHNTVSIVRRSVEEISVGSRQIAAGNVDLSSRTEEQAASLQETAASMEELSSTVRQNADNSRQANDLANTASQVAQRGGGAVGQVVNTMNGISDSSKKIAEIVSVIEGIAFQTNILALNAAVEAARAGEEGRGFAVVAGEVRSLALRSADAAKEIKYLIDESVGKVAAGAQHVQSAGATMNEVVASVRQVTDIMGEISAASIEQSSGIEQVNLAVVQMDQVTQQNAALVEEAAAAASSLQDQVQYLAQAVAVFKINSRQESLRG